MTKRLTLPAVLLVSIASPGAAQTTPSTGPDVRRMDPQRAFMGVVLALSKHYRVIALDQRGYGKSDKSREPSAYGSHVENFAARQMTIRSSAEVDTAAARIATPILERLDAAWTAGDAARFAAEFSDDADVINVSGDHFHTRADIAKQTQAIFSTVFKGSTHRSRTLELARYLGDGMIIVVSSSVIDVPAGPVAPLATSRQTFIIRERAGVWQIRHWHNTPIRAR